MHKKAEAPMTSGTRKRWTNNIRIARTENNEDQEPRKRTRNHAAGTFAGGPLGRIISS